MRTRTVKLWRDRATQTKWVYTEERAWGDTPVIGKVYLDKGLTAEWGEPEFVTVTITVPDEE